MREKSTGRRQKPGKLTDAFSADAAGQPWLAVPLILTPIITRQCYPPFIDSLILLIFTALTAWIICSWAIKKIYWTTARKDLDADDAILSAIGTANLIKLREWAVSTSIRTAWIGWSMLISVAIKALPNATQRASGSDIIGNIILNLDPETLSTVDHGYLFLGMTSITTAAILNKRFHPNALICLRVIETNIRSAQSRMDREVAKEKARTCIYTNQTK